MSYDIDIDKAYVSPDDRFLVEFNATHEKSPSQMREFIKHQRIARMRDDKNYQEDKSQIWEQF